MACEYCHRDCDHHPRCPLAPEPKSYGKCEACGEGIYEGEEYIENDNGKYIHLDCPSALYMAKFLGYEVKTMGGENTDEYY